MPAIHLPRLKAQVQALVAIAGDAPQFIRQTHELFYFYANRAQRQGQSGAPPPVISWYNLPLPAIRTIQAELAPFADREPEQSLLLCDAMWAEEIFEFRLLAASLLGEIPPEPPEPILQRIQRWALPGEDEKLLKALIDKGFHRLLHEKPDYVIQQIETWLTDSSLEVQELGLRALVPLVNNPDFENLPAVFTLLGPFMRAVPPPLRDHIVAAVKSLARRSPIETAFILRKNLETFANKDIAWLARQALEAFPPEIRSSLRQALRVAMLSGDHAV